MIQQLNNKQASSLNATNPKFSIESLLFGFTSRVRTMRLTTMPSPGAILVFTFWTLTAPLVNAQSDIENTVTESITIQALIDGKSQLHLQGNSVQWFHLDFAAPGRHPDDDGNARSAPTVVNDEEWFPVWPDQPDAENRQCNCFSDMFEGVIPSISSSASNFNLELTQVRDNASIIQYPAPENEYTLIIEFDDNDSGGPIDYIVKLTFSDTFMINAGVNDAWYNPETDGQGFFITVFPDLNAVSLAWFTYDTGFPAEDATANLGDPGHRWLTAVGPIEGNQAIMEIETTSGGLFDTATVIDRTDPPGSDGTITLTFESCSSGTIEYDIPSINRQGTVPIQRVAGDNIVLCEALSME